jgi:peptidoglycan hydrolase CwlO-like protein
MNDHLDFDTDFLDNSTSGESRPSAPKSTPPSGGGGSKKGWIIAAIVIGVLIVIGSMEGSSSSTSTYTPTSKPSTATQNYNNNDLVDTGEFWCSSYHNRKSTELEPTYEYQIELERSRLSRSSSEVDLLESRINNSTVTEYSYQWEIDQYNQMINDYNYKLTQYNTDSDKLQLKIDRFNREVEIYNNYLITNCDPK